MNRIESGTNFTNDDSAYLEYYLQEMNFVCQSVTMALQVTKTLENNGSAGTSDKILMSGGSGGAGGITMGSIEQNFPNLSNCGNTVPNLPNLNAGPVPNNTTSSHAGQSLKNLNTSTHRSDEENQMIASSGSEAHFQSTSEHKGQGQAQTNPSSMSNTSPHGASSGNFFGVSMLPSRGISPSAMLKASRRVQELYKISGDLCVCLGTLCVREADSATWTQQYAARFKIVTQNKTYLMMIKLVGNLKFAIWLVTFNYSR